ncbi:hypothetical protein OH76DRAFT_1490409 [Lentinus brumalis]|uniref:Uncharacterized protein n=1 Tax=Lentinus brumalis TaxID=2498619 RepID=A0A371CJ48_9APHY|nr:hypothetical protein OH76DRAFT_1490409 [Polyporus brumalis]
MSDYHELDFLGFYVSGPPLSRPRCRKEAEFLDWLYTALERGIHSREWIFASSKSGRNSNKGAHDVCCSRCGHLTADQDLSRERAG